MALQPAGEAPPNSHQDKIEVVAEALRRRSEKDGPRSLSFGDPDSEKGRRILADMILRGAALYLDAHRKDALHEKEAGWKQVLHEEMEPRVPDFAWRDFEEAFDLIVSPSYRDFFLFCAEEGPMPDELWEALRERETDRSTTIPIEKLLGEMQEEEMTEEEVLEALNTELSEFVELLGYDETTGEIEVRMRRAMRDKVGSAYLENLGASASAEPAGTESGADRPEEAPTLNFEAAGTFAKRHEATAVLGLLSKLRKMASGSPTPEQEKKRHQILRGLAYPVRRRLLGKPSTLEMRQDPPHELGAVGDAVERYADALQNIDVPRPRYYAEQLAQEYPDRTITDAEPHPTRSGQVLTLSGEEAPKVTVLSER